MKFFSKEVKIAVVAIFGIVILFFGMNFLKGMSVFSNDNIYFIKFKDISGLSASNPIFADGYQVGVVKGIDYDYNGNGEIVVRFGVGNTSNGLMGTVSALVPSVEKILPKLDSIMTSLNTLLADPAIAQSLHNIRSVTTDLTTSSKQLNILLAGLNRQVPGLFAQANGILSNTSTLTSNLAAVDVAGTMAQVNQTLANVQTLTQRLNSNEGTLGLLMNDDALYHRLNATVLSADSLLINVREHPKRYVHFSVFGKKDK